MASNKWPVPKEIKKIKLEPGEVLVWALDYEQYKLISKEKLDDLHGAMQQGFKKVFPNNKVIITIGDVELTVIKHVDEVV